MTSFKSSLKNVLIASLAEEANNLPTAFSQRSIFWWAGNMRFLTELPSISSTDDWSDSRSVVNLAQYKKFAPDVWVDFWLLTRSLRLKYVANNQWIERVSASCHKSIVNLDKEQPQPYQRVMKRCCFRDWGLGCATGRNVLRRHLKRLWELREQVMQKKFTSSGFGYSFFIVTLLLLGDFSIC